MTNFLQRYQAGEYEQVWSDLLHLGADIRQSQYEGEARAVARETMRRAKHNLDLLIPRLTELKYVFSNDAEEFFEDYSPEERVEIKRRVPVYGPPQPEVQAHLTELETLVGVLPLSLYTWYEVVGSVNLIGRQPDWVQGALPHGLDPLFVYPLDTALEQAITYINMGVWERDPVLTLSPDEYHKYGISGLGGYGIRLPNASADAPLLLEWHHTTFVHYLRICFKWGGFPGLECKQRRPEKELAYLTEGFLPI